MKKLMSLLLASSMLLTVIPVTDYSYATTKQTQTKTKAQLDKEKKAKAEQEKKLKEQMNQQTMFFTNAMDDLSLMEECVISAYVDGEIGYGTYTELMDISSQLSVVMIKARDAIKKNKKPLPTKQFDEIYDMAFEFKDIVSSVTNDF